MLGGGGDGLQLRMFGRFTACGPLGCQPIGAWRDRHAGRRGIYLLLARLGLEHGHWLTRERLIDSAWPEADYAAAESSFYAALRALRARLEEVWPSDTPWITCEAGSYRLRPEANLEVDALMMRAWSRHTVLQSPELAADRWERIWHLYRGPFLEDAPAAEPWVYAARHAFEELAITSALALADDPWRVGGPGAAVEILWAALTSRPDDERLRAKLEELYMARGIGSLVDRLRSEFRNIDARLSHR